MRKKRDVRDKRRFFYQSIADRFDALDNPYDVSRRIEVIFDQLLRGRDIRGMLVLDAGCGYGAFSEAARERGASIVTCDIAEALVRRAASPGRGVVADACKWGFRDNCFDVVISSEMIEHTESPRKAVAGMAKLVKHGGLLVLTTPNKLWEGVVRLASLLRLRPFQGLENFMGWGELEEICEGSGLALLAHIGFHPWPFQIKVLQRLSRRLDYSLGRGAFARIMINQAVLARRW